MFNDSISGFLSPLGFKVKVSVTDSQEDYNVYTGLITGSTHTGEPLSCEIDFAIPKPYDGRIFRIEGSSSTRNRIVCHKVFFDVLDPINVLPENLAVKRWQFLVIDAVNNALHEACFDWKFGGEKPNGDLVTNKIFEWFNTCPFVMDVDPANQIQVNSISDMVVFDLIDSGASHNPKVFMESWLGLLDPCSTPTSDRINLVYRLANGAKIKDGKIVPSKEIFCKTIVNNALNAKLNPRRAYLLRNTFENSVRLVNPEVPKIANPNNQLQVVNLLTAVMHLDEHTFEDCIAISQSAAEKLSCYVEKNQVVKSQSTLKSLIKVDDVIKPGDVIAEDEAGNKFHFNKLNEPVACISIETGRRSNHGRIFNCIKFNFCTVYPLINGDKLSNRGAIKGVVKIISDKEMPTTEQGQIIDICISPESVYKRRCMMMPWEMMASKSKQTIVPHYYDASPSFEELAEECGGKDQLFINGIPLKEQTFIGNIAWLRLNKHATDMLSAKGTGAVKNQYGLKVDDASISGQRRDFAKAIALVSRDLGPILEESIKDTVGIKNLNEYLEMVL